MLGKRLRCHGLRPGGGSTPERERFVDFLERVVVKKRLARHPEVFRKASPIARVRPDARRSWWCTAPPTP